MADIEKDYLRLYGKRPSFTELEQYSRNRANRVFGDGGFKTRYKAELSDEEKMYKAMKIMRAQEWKDKVKAGLEYLQTVDRSILGKGKSKGEINARKNVIVHLVSVTELNFNQTAEAINEYMDRNGYIIPSSVAYIYGHTKIR